MLQRKFFALVVWCCTSLYVYRILFLLFLVSKWFIMWCIIISKGNAWCSWFSFKKFLWALWLAKCTFRDFYFCKFVTIRNRIKQVEDWIFFINIIFESKFIICSIILNFIEDIKIYIKVFANPSYNYLAFPVVWVFHELVYSFIDEINCLFKVNSFDASIDLQMLISFVYKLLF